MSPMVRMQRALLVALFRSGMCYAQNAANSAVTETVQLYVDLVSSHELDVAWRRAHLDQVYHQNLNFLGVPNEYAGIPEKLVSNEGRYFFTSCRADSITEAKAWVDWTKPKTSEEIVYFAKLQFQLIAADVNGKLQIFPQPKEASEYLVLALDIADGRWKIIDSYPSMKSVYIAAAYAIAHYRDYRLDKSAVKALSELLRAHEAK